MARSAEFVEVENMIRDKIVFGMSDLRIKERLLREKDLDLAKAVDICRAAEASRTQIQSMCKMPRVSLVHMPLWSGDDVGTWCLVFIRNDRWFPGLVTLYTNAVPW